MARILALGTGPLLESGVRSFSAHCLRTWQIVGPVRAAGHDVRLLTMPIYSEEPEKQVAPGLEERTYEGLSYGALRNCDDAFNLARLAEAAAEFRPDALLGINSYPCAILSRLDHRAPMWADLYGSVVIEGQVKARVYGNNSMLGFYWGMEEAALRRADRFSTVCMRQFYALHGELAAVGRLNRHTFAHPFAACIPAAYNPGLLEPGTVARGKRKVRGATVPSDAFVLLWSGGYNSWTNVDALVDGVERAMERLPDLRYVSTGGPIHGHDDLTYPRFLERVRTSRFKDRFVVLGWIDADDVPGVWAQADLGLCVDSRHFETMFGARTRTVNMLAFGLPVLTTRGAEISDELVAGGWALGCEPDDPDALADAIVAAHARRGELKALGAKGRDHVLANYSCEKTVAPLLEWLKAPDHAPDNAFKLARAEAHPSGMADANGKAAIGERASNGLDPDAHAPFLEPANPIEDRLARMESADAAALANGHAAHAPRGVVERVKRGVEAAIGEERYSKLRFLRNSWWKHYYPRYRERMREIDRGELGRLEDLYVFLTNACNARCKHCFYIDELGHVPGELTLDDYRRLAPTIPPLRQLTLTGGEAIMHPQCRDIVAELGRATRADRVTIISNGFLPGKLEATCASLLEERAFPGVLDVLISLDGLEETHNKIRGNKRAWLWTNHSLELMTRLKAKFPGRFDVGVITIVTDRNWREIEPLDEWIHTRYGCRHGFEIVRGASFSLWGMPEEAMTSFDPPSVKLPPEEHWDEILATLQKINRRAGIPNHAFHLTAEFTFRMLRTKRKIMDCVSAGRNVGVLYPKGEVAHCEFSKSFGNVRDHGMDFAATWLSPEADAMREKISHCHCTHGCYLSKNIEYSAEGQWAMLTKL